MPRALDGRTLKKAKGQDIEAITFVPDSKHPQGALFLVANQAFDLTDENDISAKFRSNYLFVTRKAS